jgi:hypothetical protein
MRNEPSLQPQMAGLTASGITASAAANGSVTGGGPSAPDAHRFYLWLLAALVAHGAVLTGFIASKPRQIGDPSGLDGAISISLVTEADLRGDATVADSAPGQPAPPPAIQAPPREPPAAPEREQTPPADPPAEAAEAPPPATPEPVMKPAIAPEALDAPREPLPKEGAGEPQPAQRSPSEKAPPKAAEAPGDNKPKPKTAEAKPSPKPTPAKPKDTKTAKLDMALPPALQAAIPGGRGAGLERPAGITRSGENECLPATSFAPCSRPCRNCARRGAA